MRTLYFLIVNLYPNADRFYINLLVIEPRVNILEFLMCQGCLMDDN